MVKEKIRTGELVWTNIENPKEEELEALQEKYGFHDLDLEDCLSKSESPKIEEYNNYVFIVFHFPIKSNKQNHISIEPLNIFLGENFMISLSNCKIKKLNDFFTNLKSKSSKRSTIFKKGPGYLLYILINELFEIYNPFVNHLSRGIREVEEEIFEGKVQKDRLYDIMNVKRQIIVLKRALLPHSTIILSLEHLHKRFISKQLELYFDDVADKISRGKVTLETMDEMIDTLQNANESLTSHNTNRVMKILTIFSVTMLPLTFLTGLYGMNVELPLGHQANAFPVIIAIMFGILLFTMAIFKFKRYL